MLFFGYSLAILMGLTLGLIGAGGSILTVPILVYSFHLSPLTATAYSLLIVGLTALVGALIYYKRNLVSLNSAFIFAIPASLSVVLMRAILLPKMPQIVFGMPKENFVMLSFAALMLLAALFMIRPIKAKQGKNFCKICVLIFGSSAIGMLTGLVGAGGGFLIIPALVILFNLPMKQAIGTSLLIISFNSLAGFFKDPIHATNSDWNLLLPFVALTIFGMIIGLKLAKKFDGEKLKKGFAAFVAVVSLFIFITNIHQLLSL